MASKRISEALAAAAGLALLMAALHAAGIAPAAGARPLEAAEIAAFLARIQGPWQGQALITPIGPRPYDISFARNAAGEVEGAAEPGGAIHTWTFHGDGEGLKLRFLSSFRGNREPILLTARGERDGAVIFQALRPEFLSVRIAVEAQSLLVRVFHGDRLHVEISLRRRGSSSAAEPEACGRPKSAGAPANCRYPGRTRFLAASATAAACGTNACSSG